MSLVTLQKRCHRPATIFSIFLIFFTKIKVKNRTLRVHKSLLNGKNEINGDWYDTNDLVEYVDNTTLGRAISGRRRID